MMVSSANMNKQSDASHIIISEFEHRSYWVDYNICKDVRDMEMYSECVVAGIASYTAACHHVWS